MRIKFQIDAERKQVAFFIKKGEMQKWVARAIKDFPELSNEQLSKRGSEFLTAVMTRAMKEVCEANQVKGWESFYPTFVFYKKNFELPIPLQR